MCQEAPLILMASWKWVLEMFEGAQSVAQGHTTGKCRSKDSNSGPSVSRATLCSSRGIRLWAPAYYIGAFFPPP